MVIIDTGCANLTSLRCAIERQGYAPEISCDPQRILQADKLFLPGVGSAAHAMKNLRERGLVQVLRDIRQPLLGICLGMQLLGRSSAEGESECLGICELTSRSLDTQGAPLPHMGWNRVKSREAHPLFKGIGSAEYLYFVHSYGMEPGAETVATSCYGTAFSAAIQCGNFYGVQFHPERSGPVGARLINNFLKL